MTMTENTDGKIDNKVNMYKLWQAGALGNKIRTWNSIQEITDSGHQGTISIRVKQAAGGGKCAYNVKVSDAAAITNEWIKEGVPLGAITYNESAPDELLITQGEIMQTYDRYELRYCEDKIKMRDAMKDGVAKKMRGASVIYYLSTRMTPSSWEDMKDLFELYPNAVLEFSVYDMCLGCYPGRNTILWECREY
jgi:hypothetical protein